MTNKKKDEKAKETKKYKRRYSYGIYQTSRWTCFLHVSRSIAIRVIMDDSNSMRQDVTMQCI
jgi:hypothetical protein